MEFIGLLFSGCFGTILVLGLAILMMAVYAFAMNVGYTELVIPLVQHFDYTLPTIEFKYWLVFVLAIGIFKLPFVRMIPKDDSVEGKEATKMIGTRMMSVLLFIVLAYLFNWWFF